MNTQIADSAGDVLTVTTDVGGRQFDVTACSPHADGFTMLNGFVGYRMPRDQLELACRQSVDRGEVCVLPRIASATTRIMIVPNSGELDAVGRQRAAMSMMDLFRATQATEVAASSLLITHFGCVPRYPQLHVLGICDAISELRCQSFLGLKVLGFTVDPKVRCHFDRDVRQALPLGG